MTTPQDRKLTAGTVLPAALAAQLKLYGVTPGGTIPPWGYMPGSVLLGYIAADAGGGAVIPTGPFSAGGYLYYNGGSIVTDTSPLSAAGTATLTNKTIQPRINSEASNGTIAFNVDLYDMHIVTAQAVAGTIPTPTGTPYQGQKFTFRIKDNGSARALTWSGAFRAVGVALPSTTVLSKILYLGFIYNSTESKYDLVAAAQ